MKRLGFCSIVVALMGFGGPPQVEAQDMGGFMDWIGHLSGPDLPGGGVTFSIPISPRSVVPSGRSDVLEPPLPIAFNTGPWNFRVSLAYNWSGDSDDAIAPSGMGLHMFTIQPGIERVLTGSSPLEISIGTGFALHRFGGDIDDPFVATSLRPIYALLSIPGGTGLNFVAGAGFQYFFKFDTTDFLPLTVDVSTTGGELTPWLMLGFEVR